MVLRRLILTFIFLELLIFSSNATFRGGGSKSRTGIHSYSSNHLSDDPGRAILAIVFMIFSCGTGIGWKIFKCCRTGQRREDIQQQRLPYPNSIYTNPILTSTVHQLNETNLSSKRPTLIPLSVGSFNHPSKIMIHKNALKHIPTTYHGEQCSSIVPDKDKDVHTSPHNGWIDTLL